MNKGAFHVHSGNRTISSGIFYIDSIIKIFHKFVVDSFVGLDSAFDLASLEIALNHMLSKAPSMSSLDTHSLSIEVRIMFFTLSHLSGIGTQKIFGRGHPKIRAPKLRRFISMTLPPLITGTLALTRCLLKKR